MIYEPWDPLADFLPELPQLTCKHGVAHNSRLTLYRLSRFDFSTSLISYPNMKAYSKQSCSPYKDNSWLEETSILGTNFFATFILKCWHYFKIKSISIKHRTKTGKILTILGHLWILSLIFIFWLERGIKGYFSVSCPDQ